MEDVILHVNGKEHVQWTGYRIESDLLTPADAWQVTLGAPTDQTPRGIQIWSPVTLTLGGELVLTGRIDRSSRQTSKGSRVLTLEGRDLAGVLCDCSAPVFAARSIGLQQAIESIVKPLGICKVRVDAAGNHEKVSIEPGMSAWDALQAVCEQNGCWPWFNPDGTLVIGGPDYTQKPAGEIILDHTGDTTNVLEFSLTRSIDDWFSEVTVLAQTHGTEDSDGQHNIKATAKDDVLAKMGVYRPHIIVDGDCDSKEKAEKLARKTLADGRLNALTIQAVVRGHRAVDENGEGPLWEPGQIVRVVSTPDRIDNLYFLMARTFLFSQDRAQTTELTLKQTGTWLPDLAKAKKKKKKGKGGSGKGEGEIVYVS